MTEKHPSKLSVAELVTILRRSVTEWNELRKAHQNWFPNLRYANLVDANLRGAKLTRSQIQTWIGAPDWQEEA